MSFGPNAGSRAGRGVFSLSRRQIGTGLSATSKIGVGNSGATWPVGTTNVLEITDTADIPAAGVRVGLSINLTGTGAAVAPSSVFGQSFVVGYAGSDTIASIIGINGTARNAGAGTVTMLTSVSARIRFLSTGVTTASAGVDVQTPIRGGVTATITTNYGIRILPQTLTGITTSWALYASGTTDNSAIAGLLRIGGVTAPTNPLSVTGKADFTGTIQLPTYTVATLPAAAPAGQKAFVSDALAPAVFAIIVGGGAVFAPVYSDGAAWRGG